MGNELLLLRVFFFGSSREGSFLYKIKLGMGIEWEWD